MTAVGDIEPDLVVAIPTLPLVVQTKRHAGTQSGEFEVQEFVVGKAKGTTTSEQGCRRDAGSAGGRRLIRTLAFHAGYRSVKHRPDSVLPFWHCSGSVARFQRLAAAAPVLEPLLAEFRAKTAAPEVVPEKTAEWLFRFSLN